MDLPALLRIALSISLMDIGLRPALFQENRSQIHLAILPNDKIDFIPRIETHIVPDFLGNNTLAFSGDRGFSHDNTIFLPIIKFLTSM
jgi:hypothetical protein